MSLTIKLNIRPLIRHAAAQSQPAQFATNRGNKLKPSARYVHAGSLPYRQDKSYKEVSDHDTTIWKLIDSSKHITHAGYQRQILERNPKRFNGCGDELEDSESDADADADAEDENPYADVKLEGSN